MGMGLHGVLRKATFAMYALGCGIHLLMRFVVKRVVVGGGVVLVMVAMVTV
jgi:hypothetical protein